MKKFSFKILLAVLIVQCTKNQPKTDHELIPNKEGALFEKLNLTPTQLLKLKSLKEESLNYKQTDKLMSEGQALYQAHCSRCHGKAGKGDGRDSHKLAIAPTNFQEWDLKFGSGLPELAYSIKYGQSSGEMPSFRNKMDSKQLWSVTQYIKQWLTK